ncbi:cytochrome P450 [Pseudonocardia bannensis]|uniref:Cytochrome P450 n=1 Tax=Pseudonocardia bannensis TaxID=630973 RepID=A0A848DCS8_9PSEU|nr:cytochrome P450 [Pseudonocardia bannensis]NMH90387.1 cytochrome P450 [Pseudonocardia bannensis]
MSTLESAGPVVGCPLGDDFDPFEGAPHAFLARARRERPVFFHTGLGAYVLTRYADCQWVHSATEGVSAQPALLSHLNVTPIPEAMRILDESGFVPAPSIVDEDGAEHRLHRSVAHPPFRVGRIRPLEQFIRRQVTERLDAIAGEGSADIVDALIYEVPATVILHMMGVPDEQMGMVKGFRGPWAIFIWGNPDEQVQLDTARMMAAFGQWARGIAARAVANPGDDMIGETVKLLREKGELENSRLWLDSWTLNAVMAGHETTTNTMAGGIVSLLENPEQWRAICEDPELIPNAVEEILRHATGVPTWRKRLLVDKEFSGVRVPAGSLVYTALNSANRDEDVFDDGETFDVRRPNANRHLTFGGGVHTCMGNHLAKLEMRIMLEELTNRLPGLELVPGQTLHYSPNTTQRGPESVQVRWDAR